MKHTRLSRAWYSPRAWSLPYAGPIAQDTLSSWPHGPVEGGGEVGVEGGVEGGTEGGGELGVEGGVEEVEVELELCQTSSPVGRVRRVCKR